MGVFSQQVSDVNDVSKRIVTVPEWGDLRVEVRSLPLAQRNQIAVSTRDKKGNTVINKYYAALIVASCFDPVSGDAAFSYSDMDMLQQKNGAATDRLATVAMELSGLTTADDDDTDEEGKTSLEKAVEEAGKASSSTETSGTDS